jgi:hypothetical protein
MVELLHAHFEHARRNEVLSSTMRRARKTVVQYKHTDTHSTRQVKGRVIKQRRKDTARILLASRGWWILLTRKVLITPGVSSCEGREKEAFAPEGRSLRAVRECAMNTSCVRQHVELSFFPC